MFIKCALHRQKKLSAFVLSLALLLPSEKITAQSISGLPFVRTFHPVEYQAGIQNWALTQDKRGIMYVANNFGLLEFDGVKWQTHNVRNGTKVRTVAIDGRGRIYIGCQGDFGYFFPDKSGKLTYTSLADSLEDKYRNFDEAWSIYIDKETVYFCTFSRIYIYNGHDFTIIEHESPLDLSFLVNRDLFVNLWYKGIGRLKGHTLQLIKGGENFKGIGVSAIVPLENEHFLISTFQDGIFTLNKGVMAEWNKSMQTFFKEAHVNCLIRLKNGNFAAGTQNNGLLILNDNGDLVMQLTRGRGLENRTVLGLYEDDLHNLWAGQNNGIAHVELGSPFTFISEQSGLPGTGYSAYLDNSTFYLGTNTGLYRRMRNETGDFQLVENTRGQVYHVGKYNQEVLLGHHKGAFSIRDKGSIISQEPGSWVFLIPRNYPNKLIEGTYAGLQVYSWENGGWKLMKKLKGFNESSRVMAEDDDGNLWVTHGYKGAFRIKLDLERDSIQKVDYYGREKGFPTNLLINVFKVRNELIFTSEHGVYKYNPLGDNFVKDDLFTTILDPGAQVWYMQEDAFGNIYFAGSTQMGVLRKNAIGEYTLEGSSFNRIRRYLNDDLINITILQNNDVLFGAKDGFIHYDPVKKTAVNTNFRTLIRRVAVTSHGDSAFFLGNFERDGSIIDHQLEDQIPNLPYVDNSLHFSFAAASYEGNAERTYQFYLENYEKDWSDWSTQAQKEYTNLKEGNYVFHVRARNSNSQISQEARFRFIIAPPWYRSMIAYILYSIAVMALLFAGFNLLDRKYQREQKIMEEKQQHELDQKESEIEKISQQSQEEITRLQNEKLEADLRHMNNELATATMHLLNKNEFITGIKNQLNQIARKNGADDSKKELLQITRDIENNISADSDWEHFQFHFDRVHGDFTTRFKGTFPALSPQEIKLSAYLRMNLSTKEIAQLLNISVRGVEISRYRLRKKLHLDRNQNLQDFILNF
jgi:hypothetical protein